jgi:proteasome lid subunit RPN8/RPN11
MIERNTTKEAVRPKCWTIDDMKRSLLEALRGRFLLTCEYPDTILLNETWMDILEDLHKPGKIQRNIRNIFRPISPLRTSPIEYGFTVVTNRKKNTVFIPTKKSVGEKTHVSFEDYDKKHFQYLLGILHSHPSGQLFSSEDILPLMTGANFFAGVVTSSKYYLAFKAKDTKGMGSNNFVNRGYLLAMARAHLILTSRNPSKDTRSFGMTKSMFRELNMPLYVGNRLQFKLKRTR